MTAALFENVTVVVDGYALSGWQDVDITHSMRSGAIAFELTATNSDWSPQAMALRYGKEIEIYTAPSLGGFLGGAGDLMCIGAVDDYDSVTGPGASKTITINGRSKGRNAIDCPPVDHKTLRVENKDLLGVAQELDEFGINWSTDQTLSKIPMVQATPGEPMFGIIDREARRLGYMLAAQTDGGIKITRAGTSRHAGALVAGQSPVNTFRVHISPRAKFQPVVVRGQRRNGTGKAALQQEYRDPGDGSDEHRPALVIGEGDFEDDDLKTRSRWQRLRMAGQGIAVTTQVSSWRDADGEIWDPGRLMALVDASEDLDQDLTLSTVRFRQSIEQGTRASLDFVDPKTHGGAAGQGTADGAFDVGGSVDG